MQPSRPNPICFKKVEQVCVEYENKCNLSSLCFYPTGGLLYHYYANIFQFKLPTDRDCVTEKTMFSTPDIDGYFMIVPKKLDLNRLRVLNAYTTHKVALEAIEEALTKYNNNDALFDNIENLKERIIDYMEEYDKRKKKGNNNNEYSNQENFYDSVDNYKLSILFGKDSTKICDLDVHLNVVFKPLFKTFDNNGFFFNSNGTELVLNKWTTVKGYKHVFIVEPIVHLFDQLYALYHRNTMYNRKVIENVRDGKPLSRFVRREVQSGKLKMQKTAFRIKIFCNKVFKGLKINELFDKMKKKHFPGALDLFERRFYEEVKRKKIKTTKTFLKTYGEQLVEEFCDDVLNDVNVVCEKLRNIYLSKLKF